MNLINGTSSGVELRAGQKITLTGSGQAVRYINGSIQPAQAVTSEYPITIGPLTVDSQWQIVAVGGSLTYAVSTLEATGMRVVRLMNAALPTYGETGVIYETELGWKRWDELTGAYLAVVDGIPAVPVMAEGGEPTISGETVEGSVLTVSDTGTWSGRPTSFTYQWAADTVAIDGETGSTYTTVTGDVGAEITCDVIAVNAVGVAEVAGTSNGITVTAAE
jgi:hypothetical protein